MADLPSRQGFLKRWGVFGLVLILVLAAYGAYLSNMFYWRNATDYGWRAMYDSGPHIVDEVFARGWQAGLRPGDRILFINNRSYDTFDELYFSVRRTEPGAVNEYTVLRGGKTVELNITNGVIGFPTVLKRSGPLFAVGLFYFFLGALVFIMRPRTEVSWVFLSMTTLIGISISYASPSDLMHPLWLFRFRQLVDILLPAPIIHLALIFPRPREKIQKSKWVRTAPYLVALFIFLFFRPFVSEYWNPPPYLDLVNNLFLLTAVLLFVGLTVSNLFGGTKAAGKGHMEALARARSKVILFGIFIGMLIPVTVLFSMHLFEVAVFPDPALFFSFFLIMFPLSIGYSIIRHNLFDVDVFIKRTVGYGLMTALVAGFYLGLAMSIKPAASAFPSLEKVSALYPVFFAVLVLFFFRPIHSRLQAGVDRLFYREKFDYREAVTTLGDVLTTVLDLKEVLVRIIHIARDIMSIDTAGVILLQPDRKECPALFVHDNPENRQDDVIEEGCFQPGDPLIDLLQREKKMVTRYDVAEDPRYASTRESCLSRFDSLRSTLALPLIFRGTVTGILLLGRKKSGRFYAQEDIILLKTLASQSAVAIENAGRAEKMKEEELIRANLSKYLSPQVVDRVIHQRLPMDLGGSRKVVTVLISDIRKFTELTERVPPDILTRILNEYFTEMAAIIFQNHGSLDKFVGDAIIAVYGAVHETIMPLDSPAASGVKTAIDMMSRMTHLNRKWADEHSGFQMDIGIGLDTGEVFMGNVGSPERMEFTVLGTAVNMASRLSELARPRQVLLSERTAAALGSSMDIREIETERKIDLPGHQRILELVK